MVALCADGDSPSTALYYGPGHTFIINKPTIPANQPYEYLGVLVSRYYANPANSSNAGDYTNQFTYLNKNQWFISKNQMQNDEYMFPYDITKSYHARLFANYGENRIFKLTVQHVFRFSDGRDILTTAQSLFYTTISQPVITLTTTGDQTTNSLITLSGTVIDEGNVDVTISATIDGKQKSVVISNTQTQQTWTLTWDVTNDNITEGTYTNITITANNGSGGTASTVYNGTITVSLPVDQYVYDAQNRLDYIILPSGKTLDYVYDDNGNLINRVLLP